MKSIVTGDDDLLCGHSNVVANCALCEDWIVDRNIEKWLRYQVVLPFFKDDLCAITNLAQTWNQSLTSIRSSFNGNCIYTLRCIKSGG
jgi:hypothetical protein